MQDIHMSRLAGWLLNTVGKAIALSMLVGFLGGVVAVAAGEPGFFWLAGIGAPLTAAIVLYNASPPYPED